jgi:hypothetical protein
VSVADGVKKCTWWNLIGVSIMAFWITDPHVV